MRISTTLSLGAAGIFLALTGAALAQQQQGGRMQDMDHSRMQGMDHSNMPGMDHSKMDAQGGQGAARGKAQDGRVRPSAQQPGTQQRRAN